MNTECTYTILYINNCPSLYKQLGTVEVAAHDCLMHSSRTKLCIVNRIYHEYDHDYKKYEHQVYLHNFSYQYQLQPV